MAERIPSEDLKTALAAAGLNESVERAVYRCTDGNSGHEIHIIWLIKTGTEKVPTTTKCEKHPDRTPTLVE